MNLFYNRCVRKSCIHNLLLLAAALGILASEGAAAAVEPESAKRAPSQIKLIAEKAKTLSAYYSQATAAFDTARTVGEVLGLIEPDDADAKFNAIHDALKTVAAGVSWQATKNFIDEQRGPAIRAIRNLKRSDTMMPIIVKPEDDQDSGNAAEILRLGGGAFHRPSDERVTDGVWNIHIKYPKADLLPQDGDMVYDWRLGIPALLEVISYRLQFIAAMDPEFRNDNLYDGELEAYRTALKSHYDTMLAGIKCAYGQPGKTALPAYYAACADIRTGLQAIEWDNWDYRTNQPKSAPEAVSARLRSDVMRAMPLFEVRAMIDTLYLYQHPWRDLTEQYQQIRAYRAPALCLDLQRGNLAAETPVWLWECDGNYAQQWIYERTSGQISNPPSGKCLDVQWASAVTGTPVWLWDCNGGDAQRWTYDHQTHVLENALGTVLGIPPLKVKWDGGLFPDIQWRKPEELEAEVPVSTWPRNEGWTQQWQADQEPPRRAPVLVQ